MSRLQDEVNDRKSLAVPKILAETLEKLLHNYKEDACILDMGAGTGHAGWELYKKGFRNIHALDASQEILDVANKKKVYQKTSCCVLTRDPSDIPTDTYDAACSTGCYATGHIPYDAIVEMIRLVKTGGYVCLFVRDDVLDSPEYHKFYPLVNSLEAEGKWKLLSRSIWPNYIPGVGAVKLIYQVTK